MAEALKSFRPEVGWAAAGGAWPDMVFSTRVRLARNLAGCSFTGRAAPDKLAELRRQAFAAARIRVNWIMSAAGPHVTLEPMFYWPDALDPLHLMHLSEKNRARFSDLLPNPAACALVREARQAPSDVVHANGAVHA